MKIVRRQTVRTQSKRMTEAYSEIFRLFNYRHEFARRNKGVSEDAIRLAKTLGFKASRFESFILDGYPLTDELYDAVFPKKYWRRREALGKYLAVHRVLPVVLNSEDRKQYLDKKFYELSVNRLGDWKLLFNSMMLFESLAMYECKVGHPVFFPVMPLVVGRKGLADSIKLGALKLDEYDAPTFVDRSVPKQVLEHYSDALDLEVEEHRYKSKIKDERLGKATFDEYLDILDHHATLSRGEMGDAKIEYYKSFMKEGMKVDTLKQMESAWRWYDQKHLAACSYRDNYVELV